jgi:hypothetical protein
MDFIDLGVWATCGPKELGIPELGDVMNGRSVFGHKIPWSTIMGCTCWARINPVHIH